MQPYAICNSPTQHEVYIFHSLSYKYTTSFGLGLSSGILMKKYSHEDIWQTYVKKKGLF